MNKVLLSILLTFLPMLASADPLEIDGIWYNLVAKAKEAEVIKNPNNYSGDVVIPASVIYNDVKYNVTSIGENAFSYCSGMTSVTIPNSVTSIGRYAFEGCSALTSVILPNSLTSIGDQAFYLCSGLTSVTIGNSVISIGFFAFSGCKGLTSVTIPSSVESIGSSAFSGCKGLTSITIPSSVTSIGGSTFAECSSLVYVTIPNSVKSIGKDAFYGCSSLTSIAIPNSVTFIDDAAFAYCSGLLSVSIPNSAIGGDAFSNCSGLKSVIIGSGVEAISDGAFEKCTDLTDVYCLAEKLKSNSWTSGGLYTGSNAFKDSYPQYMTLHVPAGSIDAYRSTEPWSQFKAIVALEGGDIPETKKCATPEISYADGKLDFTCETEGVEFVSEVTVEDAKKYYDASVTLSQTYKVTVYATKAGYENSDVSTREIVIEKDQTTLFGDINKDGKVNVADHVKLSDIIMNNKSTIEVPDINGHVEKPQDDDDF